MEPELVERDRMLPVGFCYFGDPFAESAGWTEENQIGGLSNRVLAYLAGKCRRRSGGILRLRLFWGPG